MKKSVKILEISETILKRILNLDTENTGGLREETSNPDQNLKTKIK